MQAIIMAGGEGTRLRPLTCNKPKPLAPLCGKPVLEYILDLLKKNSFTKSTLTLMYQANKIVSHFEDDCYNGIELEYTFEDVPLGTAGSVKKACHDDLVLVISGDAMCDFDLSAAIEFHKSNNADATIIVKSVKDPREFGLVLYSSEGDITGFVEKPSYEGCTTDMANTGVYILSASAINLIEDDVQSDFAQDIFPVMLKNKMKLMAYEEKGYWCDIGDLKAYLKCQQDMLEGKVACNINARRELDGLYTNSSTNFNGVKIVPPCYLGHNVSIGEGSVIEAGSIICDEVTISKNSKIHASVILDGAFLGENVSCNEAIVCEHVKMLKGSCAFEGCVIGEKSTVGENSVIESGVRIWQSKEIENDTIISYDIKYGQGRKLTLDEDGLVGETNGEITPSVMSRLGAAMGSSLPKHENKMCVGYSDGIASHAFASSLISGGMSSGTEVWDFGSCTINELIFCMQQASINLGCYIDSGKYTQVKILSSSGLPIIRKQERKIESGLNRDDYKKADGLTFGEYRNVHELTDMYLQFLKNILPKKIIGVRPEFKCSDLRISNIINAVITSRIDDNGNRIVFHISENGQKVSCYTEETGYVFYEKLVILCSKFYFEKGADVAVPYSFPLIIDEFAKKYNRKVLRYFNCSFDSSDEEARKLATECTFVNDGIVMSLLIINYLYENGFTLFQAINDIPEFYSTTRFVPVKQLPENILKELSHNNKELKEGVVVKENDNRVLIRPCKTGKGLRMFVECTKSEIAAEICNKYEKMLKDNSMF